VGPVVVEGDEQAHDPGAVGLGGRCSRHSRRLPSRGKRARLPVLVRVTGDTRGPLRVLSARMRSDLPVTQLRRLMRRRAAMVFPDMPKFWPLNVSVAHMAKLRLMAMVESP
jgi:hypothetical protein